MYLHTVSTVDSFFLERSTMCVCKWHMRTRPGENLLLSSSTSSLSLSAHTHSMLTLEKCSATGMETHRCSFLKASRCCLERSLPKATAIFHRVLIPQQEHWGCDLCPAIWTPWQQKDALFIWEKWLIQGTSGTFFCARVGCAFQCSVKVKSNVLWAPKLRFTNSLLILWFLTIWIYES